MTRQMKSAPRFCRCLSASSLSFRNTVPSVRGTKRKFQSENLQANFPFERSQANVSKRRFPSERCPRSKLLVSLKLVCFDFLGQIQGVHITLGLLSFYKPFPNSRSGSSQRRSGSTGSAVGRPAAGADACQRPCSNLSGLVSTLILLLTPSRGRSRWCGLPKQAVGET